MVVSVDAVGRRVRVGGLPLELSAAVVRRQGGAGHLHSDLRHGDVGDGVGVLLVVDVLQHGRRVVRCPVQMEAAVVHLLLLLPSSSTAVVVVLQQHSLIVIVHAPHAGWQSPLILLTPSSPSSPLHLLLLLRVGEPRRGEEFLLGEEEHGHRLLGEHCVGEEVVHPLRQLQ